MTSCKDKLSNFIPIFTIKVPLLSGRRHLKSGGLTRAQKEIVAAENKIQICPSQLDTFDPY